MKNSLKTLTAALLCIVIAAALMGGCAKRPDDAQDALSQISSGADAGDSLPQTAQEPNTDDDTPGEPENGDRVSQVPDTDRPDAEAADEPQDVEPEPAEPAPEDVPVQTEYGSGSWIISSFGGDANEYNDIKFVNGEMVYHYIESDEGKGGFGADSPNSVEKSPLYGMTVEEIVAKLEGRGFSVTVSRG